MDVKSIKAQFEQKLAASKERLKVNNERIEELVKKLGLEKVPTLEEAEKMLADAQAEVEKGEEQLQKLLNEYEQPAENTTC